MSDNVYHVKPPTIADVTQRNQIDFEVFAEVIKAERQTAYANGYIKAHGKGYAQGVEDERDRLVNSLQEYIVTEVYGGQAMSQDNQDLLEAFVDWHLEGAE